VAFIEKRLALLADCSLFITDAVLQDALAFGFPKERCVLVGLDFHEVFQKAANDPAPSKEPILSRLRDLGVPEGAMILGCVGRLIPLKGMDLFLEAAKKLAPAFPGWTFVIKGDGPLRDSIGNTIREQGLSDRIILFTDELPYEQLPALYRCFDLFTLPTRREGFGMVFAEAMIMGTPVVAPRIAPVTEVVPEGYGVLVEPENVETLVEALGRLMADAGERHALAEKGRQHALATWTGQKAADRVLDVYQKLLEEKGL
jgi:mannosyltransferase